METIKASKLIAQLMDGINYGQGMAFPFWDSKFIYEPETNIVYNSKSEEIDAIDPDDESYLVDIGQILYVISCELNILYSPKDNTFTYGVDSPLDAPTYNPERNSLK